MTFTVDDHDVGSNGTDVQDDLDLKTPETNRERGDAESVRDPDLESRPSERPESALGDSGDLARAETDPTALLADPESAWSDLPEAYGVQRAALNRTADRNLLDAGEVMHLPQPEFIGGLIKKIGGAISDVIDEIGDVAGYVVKAGRKAGVFIVQKGAAAGLELVKTAAGTIVPYALSALGGPSLVKAYELLSPGLQRAFDQWLRKNERRGAKVNSRTMKAGLDALAGLEAEMESGAESAPMPGAETEEALARLDELTSRLEAAEQPEMVIGVDDRVRVESTTSAPYLRICALRIRFPSGRTFRGTGFLVGPRCVVTAGHCVYMPSQDGWAEWIEVIPGANGDVAPFGRAVSRDLRSVVGWVEDGEPASDYGAIILPEGAFDGRDLGSFGFAALSDDDLLGVSAVISGYPGDKPFAEAWTAGRIITDVTDDVLRYEIDTAAGQSGAPVVVRQGDDRYVVGIHNYGTEVSNSATRISPSRYRRIDGWRRIA